MRKRLEDFRLKEKLEVNAEKKVWKTVFGLNSLKYPRKLEFWV